MRIKRVMAAHLHAGDYLVIKDGNITKYCHVNEVYKNKKIVKVSYKMKDGSIVHERHKPRHPLRIRVRR